MKKFFIVALFATSFLAYAQETITLEPKQVDENCTLCRTVRIASDGETSYLDTVRLAVTCEENWVPCHDLHYPKVLKKAIKDGLELNSGGTYVIDLGVSKRWGNIYKKTLFGILKNGKTEVFLRVRTWKIG